MRTTQEVNIDKLVVVWTREQYFVEAETQQEAIEQAKKLEQTGEANNVEVIWDSLEPIEPLQIVQNRIAESTVQLFVEGVYCEDNNPKLIPFEDVRIIAEVQNVTDVHADCPNWLRIEISKETCIKVKSMLKVAKEQDVIILIPDSAEYFHTKEEAETEAHTTYEFAEGHSGLMVLPTGGVYFEAHSKYDWGTQIESEDISQYFA